MKDFAPIARIGVTAFVLMTRPDFKAKSSEGTDRSRPRPAEQAVRRFRRRRRPGLAGLVQIHGQGRDHRCALSRRAAGGDRYAWRDGQLRLCRPRQRSGACQQQTIKSARADATPAHQAGAGRAGYCGNLAGLSGRGLVRPGRAGRNAARSRQPNFTRRPLPRWPSPRCSMPSRSPAPTSPSSIRRNFPPSSRAKFPRWAELVKISGMKAQ